MLSIFANLTERYYQSNDRAIVSVQTRSIAIVVVNSRRSEIDYNALASVVVNTRPSVIDSNALYLCKVPETDSNDRNRVIVTVVTMVMCRRRAASKWPNLWNDQIQHEQSSTLSPANILTIL